MEDSTDWGSERRGSVSEDLCAAWEGRVILAIVAAVFAPLAEYSEFFVALAGSFCNGSFSRLAAAAAPKLEIDMDPCIWCQSQFLSPGMLLLSTRYL
jgi:hypothetical protein